MRVLVTGGAGFIGSHVVRHALDAGFEVAVLDDFSTGKQANVPPGVRVFNADLCDRDAVLGAVADFRPELVNHQAAQASVQVSKSNPRFDAEVNVIGGLNLLDACTTGSRSVRRFVFASTAAIYAEMPEGVRATESFPFEPKSPYGVSKLSFERLLTIYREQRGLEMNVLRYANVYGPRQNPRAEAGVVAIFFDSALAQKHLTVFARRTRGDGGCSRDYVFVGDVARANLFAMSGKLPHAVMNVGTGRATSTLELAESVLRLTGSRGRIEQADPRAGDSERSVFDASRFQQALGAPTPLDAGLAQTAQWYRDL
jgi:UDP-glucose 4-epimerase